MNGKVLRTSLEGGWWRSAAHSSTNLGVHVARLRGFINKYIAHPDETTQVNARHDRGFRS